MPVYLDNAATTPLDTEVLEVMLPYLTSQFGNPSTQYSYGRETRSAIEESRKTIAQLLHCTPGEIVFTSGGTEANNTALKGAVEDLGVQRIITSEIEHHCVMHTAEYLNAKHGVELVVLPVDEYGKISLQDLETQLAASDLKTLVTIMHANNEIGVLQDIKAIGQLCRQFNALFHTDTVQTFAHYILDTTEIPVDYLSAAAHKFHGPKGVGFLYMRKTARVGSFIHGGGQERNQRAGTENVAGIVGMAFAAQKAYKNLEEDIALIRSLKEYAIESLSNHISGIEFNGPIDESALYTVLNISLPPHPLGSLLLFQLDMDGICVSGGSACSSGASTGSHVIAALKKDPERISIRVSFSRNSTHEEINALIASLKKHYHSEL
jgi:cysteine desulfurase